MLALTRKIGERIVINDNIVLTVVDIRGDSVRLSFDAPRDVKIYRGELFEAIAAENKQAVMPSAMAGLEALKEIKKEK